MTTPFVCPRCGNKDPRYVGYRQGRPYCRKCLSFAGKNADKAYPVKAGIHLVLDYPLSPKQQEVSQAVLQLLANGHNVLIHAVTGAGKTELVYAAMETYLKKSGHVGFATPRKDVVIDLLPRIQQAFPQAKTIAVYGEHTALLEGDIVVLTTHQLYRYDDYFDLLILDEIDAFPFRDNEMLQTFFRHSVRGHYVLLSATPSRQDLAAIKKDNGEVVELFERYHHHPLPVPEYVSINPLTGYAKVLWTLRQFRKAGKPVFIFTPTIALGKELYRFLHLFFTDGRFVSSEEEERKVDIARFKEQGFSYLVTTSILERGVTVKDLQVIVYQADHDLYTAASLVQISGRVGRKLGATGGQVLLMAQEENETIREAIESIQAYNQKAGL